jgi:hypothetical protein
VVFFTLNWLFLFGFWGIFAVFYWTKIGLSYLLSYLAAPVLLALITIAWIRKLFQKKIDLDFKRFKNAMDRSAGSHLGIWYPTYLYGQGFVPKVGDLLFSIMDYALPDYDGRFESSDVEVPEGNRTLFNLMTAYAIIIGTATVLTGWLPDIPFFSDRPVFSRLDPDPQSETVRQSPDCMIPRSHLYFPADWPSGGQSRRRVWGWFFPCKRLPPLFLRRETLLSRSRSCPCQWFCSS